MYGLYVTLSSNASAHIYPNNKICRYRTKLVKPIVLNEPYEVGVIEVQYPRIWTTFLKSDAVVEVFTPSKKKKTKNSAADTT